MASSIEEMNRQLSAALNADNLNEALRLVNAGANIEATNSNGYTALMIAAGGGHADAVTTLLAKGANIEATNNDGYTALMLASQKGKTEIVKIIQEAQQPEATKPKTTEPTTPESKAPKPTTPKSAATEASQLMTLVIQSPGITSGTAGLLVALAVVAAISTLGVAPALAAATGLSAAAATYATAATVGVLTSTATFFSMPNSLSAHALSQNKDAEPTEEPDAQAAPAL